MGKKKKDKTGRDRIRQIIKQYVWWGRDDHMHGIYVAADLIDREIVEEAYQQGWLDSQTQAEGVVLGKISTRHPGNYLLVNVHDGTFWALSDDGRWLAAEALRFENKETLKTETVRLADYGLGTGGTGTVVERDTTQVVDEPVEDKAS